MKKNLISILSVNNIIDVFLALFLFKIGNSVLNNKEHLFGDYITT